MEVSRVIDIIRPMPHLMSESKAIPAEITGGCYVDPNPTTDEFPSCRVIDISSTSSHEAKLCEPFGRHEFEGHQLARKLNGVARPLARWV